jgi:tetratricopeptide (TPR) repeat protein
MFNLAGLVGEREAADLAMRCLAVEPNFLAYAKNAVIRCAIAGNFVGVIQAHNVVLDRFGYDHEMTTLAIDALLRVGMPEMALDLRTRRIVVDSPVLAGLDTRIERDLTAKLTATRLLARARPAVLGDEPDLPAATGYLREAYETYEADVAIHLNYALVLAATDQLDRAAELLDELARVITSTHGEVLCLVNLAYLRLRQGHIDDGAEMLLRVLMLMSGQEGTIHVTTDLFPRPSRWVGHRYRAYPISQEETHAILEAACAAEGGDPRPVLLDLKEMYEERSRDAAAFVKQFQDAYPSSDE